jgi:hypothetical protein
MTELKEKARQTLPHTDPRSRSLVGAVLADPIIYDYLQYRLRDNVKGMPEGQTAARVLDLEDIGTLTLILTVISENGGNDVELNSHGAIAGSDGKLEFLRIHSLRQLRANGFITLNQSAGGYTVGVGQLVRATAKRWGISIPLAVDGAGA